MSLNIAPQPIAKHDTDILSQSKTVEQWLTAMDAKSRYKNRTFRLTQNHDDHLIGVLWVDESSREQWLNMDAVCEFTH